MTIELSDLPAGKDFEDYIAAYFQETGYFLEKNITERHEDGEVLEIDVTLTDYDKNPLEMILVEVKSKECKFSDIFKIRGWMYYLNFYKGIFISREKSDNFNFQKQIAKTIDIDVVQIGDLSNTAESLNNIIKTKEFDNKDIEVWRFSYLLERALLNRLNVWKKSIKDKKCFRKMYEYQFKTDNDVFFNKNIIQRLSGLYDTFFETPHLTANVGHELIGEPFEGEYSQIPKEIFKNTFYECKYNPIQISMYIEHKTRLSILKSAIDYKVLKDAGCTELTENEVIKRLELLGIEFEETLLSHLPTSFKNNLNSITEDNYFHRYPVFWQVFLWLFGGFILNDYKEEEYNLLSQKTGIPIDEIPNAFKSYGKLFPLEKGWFQELPNTNIEIMKMFPIPFRGIGAHYRKVKFTEQKFEDLSLTGFKTRKDLAKWNNLAYEILKADLKL